MAAALAKAKAQGVSVSLDMAMPDPQAASGAVDWREWLAEVLPQVDLFMPSFDETLFMLRREHFEAGSYAAEAERLNDLCDELLACGAAVVGLKLGERGLFVKSADAPRLARMGRAAPAQLESWAGRQLWAPVLRVRAQGTTGAGDTTIAGFVASLLRGLGIEEAMRMASAVGACSVEGADAVSGVQSWQATRARLDSGWARAPGPAGTGWREGASGLWRGPADRG